MRPLLRLIMCITVLGVILIPWLMFALAATFSGLLGVIMAILTLPIMFIPLFGIYTVIADLAKERSNVRVARVRFSTRGRC